VGAVVFDAEGRVFVQRRTAQRANLPGCWDIVGGHVEPGETYAEALAREIAEETGWMLTGVDDVLGVFAWWGSDGVLRRELDCVARVDGRLDAPRLAPDEHDLFRWLVSDEVAVLDENADRDGGLIRAVVDAAFARAALRTGPPEAGGTGPSGTAPRTR